MFVLEIRDSRCRSAGAMSGILGHVLCLCMPEFLFFTLVRPPTPPPQNDF